MNEETVRQHFLDQSKGCARMGSAFTATLCRLASERLSMNDPVGAKILGWKNDPGTDALALRWCGALHGLVLDNLSRELRAAYPPVSADIDTLWSAVESTSASHSERLKDWLASPPQTNEIGRSSILLAGALRIAAKTGLPLDWREIGASAGLNLQFDRLHQVTETWSWGNPEASIELRPIWTGAPPPVSAPLVLSSRAGCDRAPVNPSTPQNETRLLAYVWPDMPERMARMRSAISLASANSVRLDAKDAADWVENELATREPDRCMVVAYTVMWQYLPEETKARIDAAICNAGKRASFESPLARLEFEWARAGEGEVALTLWPGGHRNILGTAHMHGAWINWLVQDAH